MRDNDTYTLPCRILQLSHAYVLLKNREKKRNQNTCQLLLLLYHVIALIFIIKRTRPRLSLMTRCCLLAARLLPQCAIRTFLKSATDLLLKTLITCGAFRSSSSYYYTYCSAPLPSIIMNTTMKYDVSAPSPTIITLLFRYRT